MSAAIDHGYFPSGKYIINHDIMNCAAESFVGNHLYSGRGLGLSEPWDIIQLHPDLKPNWFNIKKHYTRIGLSHSRNVIWNLNLTQLGNNIGFQPSVFYFGPNACNNWGDRDWLETVEFINSKNNFIALAHELGIDVPQTQCFDNVCLITDSDIQTFTYPCYLKAAISVSGVGSYRCEDKFELLRTLVKFDADMPVQVQEEIKTDTFFNLQYRVVGNTLVRLEASEQILDDFVHQGNRVPASHEPWKEVDVMAQWLKDRGMKGFFSFDVAVVQTDRGLRFLAIECNPRFNDASYPTCIAQKLDIPEWSAISMSTKVRSLSEVDISDIEFDKQTGEGVIIVNWGIVSMGKLVVLLAGSREYQDALLLEIEARLC